MIGRLACLWLALALPVPIVCKASERIPVCFNYGCGAQAEVIFSDAQLEELRQLLGRAPTPAEEREAVGEAVGRLLGWAGRQSPIGADRGGNYADDAVYGRMDCIDHATTTTRLLRLLERRGMLRFHRVLEPVLRRRFLIFLHHSALIEEAGDGIKTSAAGEKNGQSGGQDGGTPARFAVDGWFFDNGHPAAVIPLDDWLEGESPNDSKNGK